MPALGTLDISHMENVKMLLHLDFVECNRLTEINVQFNGLYYLDSYNYAVF